jgi:hypothetical protein
VRDILSILSILIIIIILFFIFFISLSLGLKIYLKLNNNYNGFKTNIIVKWMTITIFSKTFTSINIENNKKNEDKANEKETKKIAKKKKKTYKEKWKDFKQLYPLIKSNIAPILDFIIVCVDSIKLQKFNTHITIGLSSFTDTATFTGYIWAFSTIPNLSNHFNLTAEPNFTKEAIDFESEIIFKIKLLKPSFAILKLFARKTMLKLIWNLRF